MTIYVVMFFLLAGVWACSIRMRPRLARRFVCVASVIILWLVQALRHPTVGTDIPDYLKFFNRATDYGIFDVDHRYEKGFQIYSNFVHTVLGLDFNGFLALTSALILVPVGLIFYRRSSLPALSFIIFASLLLYRFSFSGLRQSMAIGLTLMSYRYLIDREPLKFVVMVMGATCLHVSAAVFLIAYPMCNCLKMTVRRYAVMGSIGVVCLLFLRPIVSATIAVIHPYSSYGHYLAEAGGSYRLMLLFFIFFLLTFLCRDRRRVAVYRMLLFIGAFMQGLGLVSDSASRIAYYFIFYASLAIPEVVLTLKGRPRWTAMTVATLFFVGFFFYTVADGGLNLVPYHFFWE